MTSSSFISVSGAGTSRGIWIWWSKPVLVDLEGRLERKDRLAVLDRGHPPRREAAAVADALDLIDDRHAWYRPAA